MSETPVKGNQGKRYSAADKAEIVKFIEAYNAEHKRGGMKAASEKYGVSVVTLSNWGRKTKSPKKPKAKKAPVQKSVKVKTSAAPKVNDKPEAILDRMLAIRAEISKLESEYQDLKKKL